MQDLLVADPEEAWFVIRDAWAAKSLGILFACCDFWFFSKDPILYIYRLYIYIIYIYIPDILCHTYAPKFIATVTRMMVRMTNEKTACAYEGTSK